MGATAKEFAPEIIEDIPTFNRRVGMISFSHKLIPLGFHLKMSDGLFDESHLDELLDFCKQNKNYHIVTITGDFHYTNRFIPGYRFYKLAKGDSNPNLVLDPCHRKSPHIFVEELNEKIAAIVAKLNGVD